MLNKLLSLPFFIFVLCMPLGLILLLTVIPLCKYLFAVYGEWSFKQWEAKRDELLERWKDGIYED